MKTYCEQLLIYAKEIKYDVQKGAQILLGILSKDQARCYRDVELEAPGEFYPSCVFVIETCFFKFSATFKELLRTCTERYFVERIVRADWKRKRFFK